MPERERSGETRRASEAATGAPDHAAQPAAADALQLFSAMGNAAVARMLQREPAEAAGTAAARKDVLEQVTNKIVEARSHFEATPPDYTKAYVAISHAESAATRIAVTPGLPPEFITALTTRGLHNASVHLEALDYSRGDMPFGVKSGINQALHDLAPIAAPAAERQLTGEGDPDHAAARKDVLEQVTNKIVEARSHFEATPPDYTKAYVAISHAESAATRIAVTPGLPPEFITALTTRGLHNASVHLEALDYSRGDMPFGVKSGINQALHDLAPIAAPAAEQQMLRAQGA